jgi:hypothetical protein
MSPVRFHSPCSIGAAQRFCASRVGHRRRHRMSSAHIALALLSGMSGGLRAVGAGEQRRVDAMTFFHPTAHPTMAPIPPGNDSFLLAIPLFISATSRMAVNRFESGAWARSSMHPAAACSPAPPRPEVE